MNNRSLNIDYTYFGARYYDLALNIWLRVDPLADKYPGTSAFMYVRGIPVMITDPNGMNKWIPPTKEGGAWAATDGDSPGSLARDAGISQEEAEQIMRDYNKANGNKRTSDIMVYSGDKVYVPTGDKKKTGSDSSETKNVGALVSQNANKSSTNMCDLQVFGNKRGTIISAVNAIAAAGPVGAMIDIGSGIDSYGESRMYFTIGWVQGYGAATGMGFGKTNKKFRFRDMEGLSSGWQGSFLIFSADYNQDMQKTGTGTSYGNRMSYFSGGLGKGLGIGRFGFGLFHYFSITVTAPIPTGEQLFNMVRYWH